MGQLARFARLDRDQQTLLVTAAALVAAFRFAIWVLPFRVVREWVQRLETERSCATRDADAIAQAVEAASRRVPFSNCLSSALAGQILMGRSGVSSEIRIGVTRQTDGRVTAHAWVEHEGQGVIGATDLERFARASGAGRVV